MSPAQESAILFRDAWKTMVKNFPDSRIEDSDGLATVFANLPLFFFNMSISTAELPDNASLIATLQAAAERGANAPFPWFHSICEDLSTPDWASLAEAAGMSPVMRLKGMSTTQLTPPTRPMPELDFRFIDNPRTYRDIAEVNALAYEMPLEAAECFAGDHLWKSDYYGVVAYVDDKPVCSTAAFPVNETIYIALVATVKEHRGKGYAEACIRHVASESARRMGLSRLTLHGTDLGSPLYAAMGFQTDATFTLVMPGMAHS